MSAQEMLTRWNKVRQGLLAALRKLTDEQLDFTPRAGLWSVRETVVHIAGTEDGWLRHYAANRWHENLLKPEDYSRRASLKTLLDEQHAATTSQFADDPEAALAASVHTAVGPTSHHGLGRVARHGT